MQDFQELYSKAVEAGNTAVVGFRPILMHVQQATDLTSGFDASKPYEVVEDGVCGFAWVNVKPGNSAFANWLKKQGKGRSDSYYGGVTVWVSEFNQSMQKKEVYAEAFSKVLKEAGIKAYASSRMD
jgi:hypothetical protein